MRKRKSTQHNRIDHSELCHRAADAERKHEDGKNKENFVLQKDAKPDTDILSE